MPGLSKSALEDSVERSIARHPVTLLVSLSKSMKVALDDLRLHKLWVVYPGERRLSLHARVEAIPLAMLGAALRREKLL